MVALILGWQLLRVGYYPMHDDLQVMRVFQMRRCLDDGQIPCRWSPDMGNNYGQPMFNYYSVFPYYTGMVFNLIGFSYVDTVKILFLLSLIVSGWAMYALVSLWMIPVAAIVAAVSFMSVPYHALDIFVRGAMSEVWALSLLPAVLAAVTYLVRKQTPARAVVLALLLGAFLTTHNLTSIISAPIILIYGLINLWLVGNKKRFFLFSLAGTLLGIGLSAFFTLPILLERNLIMQESLITDYFNFHAHFTTLRQLFLNLNWGYGPSKFGPDDDISFFLGIGQMLVLVMSPVIVWGSFRKNKQTGIVALFFMIITGIGVFMTHGKSVLIWDTFKFLAIVQFPWRFLGLFALGSAISLGFMINALPKKIILVCATILSLFLIVSNFSYFRFEKYFYWINDEQKLSGELYNLQVRAAMLDYLPNAVKKIPIEKASVGPIVRQGRAEINYFDKRSAYFSTEIDVSEDETIIDFPVVYFPNWTLYHNRSEQPFDFNYDNDYGVISIKLDRGHHLIQAWLENTTARWIGNGITLLSAFTIILWICLTYAKRKK